MSKEACEGCPVADIPTGSRIVCTVTGHGLKDPDIADRYADGIINAKADLPGGGDVSDTDLDVELRGGARYTLSSGPDLFLSLFVGREAQVQFGVAFWPKGRD